MSDDGVLRRFPDLIRDGNGVTARKVNGIWQIGVDLDTLTVRPTDAAAPMLLADLLAMFLAGYSASASVITIDDGFYDVPGTGNRMSADDGFF